MKSIWTIMLNVLVRIGQLTQCATRAAVRAAQHVYSAAKRADQHVYRALVSAFPSALKTVLVCAISVAMWLPVCLTAETAVAADGANSSSETSANTANEASNKAANKPSANTSVNTSASPDSHSGSEPVSNSADSANSAASASYQSFSSSSYASSDLSSLQSFGNHRVFVNESNPFAQDLSFASADSNSASQNMSPLERAAKEAQAQAQNRDAKNYTARESYEVYRPGCNKDYALGACITTDGDGAGLRATNGHDLDVNSLGYNLESGDQFASAATRPRGHYENGPVPEDPSGTDHYGATYFTPYPKGTFIMGRLRNMAFNYKGSGVDRINLPIDDTSDFVFVKRTPKLSGGGFVWDVIFNAGGRTQGAGAALDYFTIPKGQILDKGSEGGRQYIQRVLYSGREATALYKKKQGNNNPPRETCSFSWDNPNGLCSIKTDGNDFDTGDDLVAAWNKMRGTDDSKNGNYSRILPDAVTTEDLGSTEAIGWCRDGTGLDCIRSSSYGALDEGDLRVVPKVEGSYSRGYSPAYVALVQNLYRSIKDDTQRVFSFVNNIKPGEIAYTYKIHFTTTTSTNKNDAYCTANKGDGTGCENFSFFYAAGSYYGKRQSKGFYGATDPFGVTKASKYSMTNFGRDANFYMYTVMHQQWYGAPRIMDIQAPRYHFLKGTGLGPYNSDSGNYLRNRLISFSSVLLGIVNQPLGSSSLMNESEDIRLLPDYYSPNNGYARGNQWFRNPGMNDHNTKDSTPGRHKLELRYNDRTYHMSETQDLWYRVITQADVFKPLQTEEYDENNKTPKYYSYDQPLPNPLIIDDRDNNAGFVNFVGKRSDLYKQVMAFDPNLFPPVNKDEYGTRHRYGSIKQKKGSKANNYPLDASYLTSNPDGDSNTPLKNLAVYKAEWTDKWGDEPRSNTLQDADLSVAAKVPIVSVVNPCGHSKILDEYKDKITGQSRSSIQFRSVDSDDASAANNDRAAMGEDREDSMPECWPKAQNATKRNVWFVSNAPKTGDDGKELKPGDPVKQELQTKVLDKIKRIYRNWMRNKYSAQLQDGKDPKVLPNYVFVKYVKITFWDNSTTVIPVVFPYVDYEKPTLDVKVSVNNGDPVDVPADGLKIPVNSKIKFWVKGHDDKRILLGVKPKEATDYFTNDKNKRFFDGKKVVVRNDFDMITTNRDKKNDCDNRGCGDFTTISYDQFIHKNGESDSPTDQVGWVINSNNSKDEGSPTVLVGDQNRNHGVHDLIFHGWDAAGNSVIKKLRLIIVSPGYGLPNVWWDKKPNGHYVGRVNPWDEDKRVRSIMVRIWARGKEAPKKDHNYFTMCPNDGSCYGIVIQRDGNKKTDFWHQVNTYNHNNDAAIPDGSRAAEDRSAEDRSALEDRDAAGYKAADGKSADGKDDKGSKDSKSSDKNDSKNAEDSKDAKSEESKGQDRDAEGEDRSVGMNNDQWREEFSKRIITANLGDHIKGCTANGGDRCEITFDPVTGNITIPEYFAEIGSRIYVDTYSVPENNPDWRQDKLWKLMEPVNLQDYEESDPLPLDIAWPNGLVQVNPFELNNNEIVAMLSWMRHDKRNERIFGYRKEEIGVKGENKYDTYDQYDNGFNPAKTIAKYAYGENKPQYSCQSKTDQQWKLCLGGVTGIGKLGEISEKKYAEKKLSFKKLEADDETTLNPIDHKVTRFVDMRKDYTWGLVDNNKKSVDGRNDPGFDGPQNGLHGNQKFGTQYFVYKWNINSYRKGGNGKPLNLQDVLKLVKGTPSINTKDENNPQPSLTPMSAADNRQFDAWNGSYPMAVDNGLGYAVHDGTCAASIASHNGVAQEGTCQWRNKLNLVKYTPKEFIMDRSSFSYNASVNMKNGSEVHITDMLIENKGSQHAGEDKYVSEYAIHKDFLMPGGEDLNGQADGENIGDIITKNIDVDTMNDYDAYGEGTSKPEGYANNRPFMHAQLYVNNGQVTNDLLLREPGKTPDNTTNVINVWFMPVDNEKPTISAKSYQEWDGKPWDIHGRCMINGDVNNCNTIDDDVITLDKKIYENNTKAWYEADKATINLPSALKLDDDFNEYEPGKGDRKWVQGSFFNKKCVTLYPNSINSKVLVNNLNVYIQANNIQDSSGKTSSPMLKFVSNGVTNKHLLRRFVEKYRSTDLENPSVNKQTVFTMYAETTDSAGKQSDKTVVGCFKATWTDMVKPSVVAYDGEKDEVAKEDRWLNNSQNRDYKVVVKSGYGAKRMVVYYHPASELEKPVTSNGLFGSTVNSNDTNLETSIGKTISVCWNGSWSVCSGTSKPNEVTLDHDDKGNAVITFPSGFLAPGSVVRARSRLEVGPWTYMPGVRSPEDLSDDSPDRDGNKIARSGGNTRAAKGRNAKVRATKSAKDKNSYKDDASSEDTLDVLPMAYAKEKPSEVCRPDYWSVSNWEGQLKPSDCVYFDVTMKRQIVQIHPMLLSGHEERAIRMDLRSENNFAGEPKKGIWLQNDSEIVTNEDPRLDPGRTMVTFRKYDYNAMDYDHKPLNLPDYGDRQVGKIQDVAVMTRGWRSRVLVPNPRENKITRFVRLRAPQNVDSEHGGDSNGAADYLSDAPTSFDETKGDKALRVDGRPYDPGFVLSQDKKSLLYLYNASTKRNFTLNDLQFALKLKRNSTLHPENECGNYVDGSDWAFADCQPSLLPEVRGSDKVDGEKSKNGFSFDWNTHFYTYNPSEDHRSGANGAANGADNDNGGAAKETWYVNVIDMISKGGTGGGYQIPNSHGVTSESSNTGLSLTNFARISAWGRSGAIDSSLIGHKILKNPDNGLSVIMTYGDSWVGDTHKTRGKDSGWNNDANYEFVMPVYLIPVDNEKPTVAATGGSLLSGHTSANNPYVVTMEEKDYANLTVKGNPVEYKDGKVSKSESKESGKTLFADVHDDYDRFGDLSNLNLVACKVKKLGGATDFNSCTSIMGNDGSVDAEAFKKLKTDGSGVEYALYGHAKDKSSNESDGFGENGSRGHLVGYFSFGYLVRPVALPYSGGQAAIWFSFLFGVLLAMFLASGAFGRRGWLASVLSGNGFGALTDSKHCDASAEALRSGKLFKLNFKFKWLRL